MFTFFPVRSGIFQWSERIRTSQPELIQRCSRQSHEQCEPHQSSGSPQVVFRTLRLLGSPLAFAIDQRFSTRATADGLRHATSTPSRHKIRFSIPPLRYITLVLKLQMALLDPTRVSVAPISCVWCAGSQCAINLRLPQCRGSFGGTTVHRLMACSFSPHSCVNS
jgi:hypothetical protein